MMAVWWGRTHLIVLPSVPIRQGMDVALPKPATVLGPSAERREVWLGNGGSCCPRLRPEGDGGAGGAVLIRLVDREGLN